MTGKSRRKKLKETEPKDAAQTSPQEAKVEEHQDPATIVSHETYSSGKLSVISCAMQDVKSSVN